jgi:hypothetical protein
MRGYTRDAGTDEAKPMTRHDLYLGRNTPNGVVSQHDFDAWLRETVDSKLEGYTVIEAKGYWHGVREDSWDLQAIDADSNVINAIARAYADRFHQDAVYVTATHGDARLVAGEKRDSSPIARSESEQVLDSHPRAADSLAGAVARTTGILRDAVEVAAAARKAHLNLLTFWRI